MSNNSRRPLISGNWKMNQNHYEAIQCLQKLAYLVGKDDFATVDVSIHAPFTDIRSVQTLIDADDLKFLLGAQHCYFEDKGAFTGEVAPAFLAKLGVKYVICGHSERRELFAETDEMVQKKVSAILANKMIPILCVGETLAEREAQETLTKVWAIGTGKTATTADAQEVCHAIRQEIGVLFGAETAAAIRIQYGGSVKAANIAELMRQTDIDGALVGGASLDPDEFARIVQYRLHEEAQ